MEDKLFEFMGLQGPTKLLPLQSIRQLNEVTPFSTADIHLMPDESYCAVVVSSFHNILIARKQGDQPRAWRSVDRAIDFIKAHFAIKTINIKLH